MNRDHYCELPWMHVTSKRRMAELREKNPFIYRLEV